MKKLVLSIFSLLFTTVMAKAQEPRNQVPIATPQAGQPSTAQPTTTLKPENMAFATDTHQFGTVTEGPAAEYEFHFVNTGKEPIILQKVQASCGCTTPTYSKDPVMPGKEGIVKASFNTQGRVGHFEKNITVVSNAGTKVLYIKGEVEKAPTSSVPENTSMMRTN